MPDQDAMAGEVVGDRPVEGAGCGSGTGFGESGEVVGAARVAAQVRDRVDVVGGAPLLECSALLGDGGGEPADAVALRQDAVGEELVGAQPAQGQSEGCGAQGVGSGGSRFGDQAYDGVAVGEHGLDGGELPVQAGRGLVQPVGGQRNAGEAAEEGAQGAGRLALGRQKAAQIAAEFLGEGEKGEGAGEGREVDNDEVGCRVVQEGGVAQGAQDGEFLGAREGDDLVGFEGRGAEEVQGGGGLLL